MRRSPQRIFPVLVLAGFLAAAPAAHAQQPLSAAESTRLGRGEIIEHTSVTTESGRRYVGGTAYAIVESGSAELDALLLESSSYRQILPYTKEARFLGWDRGDLLVRLKQGNALFDASYTVRVRKLPQAHEVRFWLEPSQPHGIEDARGYFRYQPLAEGAGKARVLLVYGIEVDIGPGLVRTLFEGTVQRIVLTVPDRLRAYVAASTRAEL